MNEFDIRSRGQTAIYEAALDSISEAVLTVDPGLLVTSFNRAAEQLAGVLRAAALGKQCRSVLRAAVCDFVHDCPMERVLSNGHVAAHYSFARPRPDGRRDTVIIDAHLMRNAAGEKTGGVEVIRVRPPGFEESAEAAPATLTAFELLERNSIEQVLARHGGRRAAASRELGISRTTLWRKLRRLQIEPKYRRK
jgi:PAS domain S-box-containing protein